MSRSTGSFLYRYFELDEADEQALSGDERRETDPRKYVAYHRLVDTGWLVEHRDKYRRFVDFDPDARLLLQALLEIKSGRLRSYGGEVLQVQALLESARSDPDTRSENISNAARSARGFLNHLRSVTGAMRKIEALLVRQTDLNELFGTYFDEFVAEQLIADYKRLHTQDNPFRFRVDILDLAQEMADERELMNQLAEAFVHESRANDVDHALELLHQDLQAVVGVFHAIDDHLQVIYQTQSRIERRVRNTVRYMDRIAEVRTERIRVALESLGASDLPPEAPISAPHALIVLALPVGGEYLYQLPRRRGEPQRKALSLRNSDPGLETFRRDLIAYQNRARITPEKLIDFVEGALEGREEVRAADAPLESLDDFFVFERLRDLPFIGEGLLRERYQVEILDHRFANEWIDCPDFVIRRTRRMEAAE